MSSVIAEKSGAFGYIANNLKTAPNWDKIENFRALGHGLGVNGHPTYRIECALQFEPKITGLPHLGLEKLAEK